MARPRGLQRDQLVADIGQLGRVGHPLRLDLQDGDLVQQFAKGHRDEDFGHGRARIRTGGQCSALPTGGAARIIPGSLRTKFPERWQSG